MLRFLRREDANYFVWTRFAAPGGIVKNVPTTRVLRPAIYLLQLIEDELSKNLIIEGV